MRTDWEISRTVAKQVAAVWRDQIVKGELAPRARIVERRRAAELSVSRTPIREALKLAEADGLIEITLHRGALVSEFGSGDALHVFDVIAGFEGLAARRTTEELTAELLQRFEHLHGEMTTRYHAGRSEEYFDVNTIVHDLIMEKCGNPILQEAHQRPIASARRGRFLAIMEPAHLRKAVEEHEQLMHAFRARDPNMTAAFWETHLRHTGDTVTGVPSDLETQNHL